MKMHVRYSLFALSVILFLIACGKKDDNKPSVKPLDKLTTANTVAKLWINNVATPLTNGSTNAKANSVYVVSNDVYVTGFENNGANNVAKIWKNGVGTALTDGSKNAEGLSIYVSGNDIYVAGYEYIQSNTITKAVIWKNGIATYLTDGTWGATANSVFVNGNDVYVTGYSMKVTGSTGIPVATLWRNGIATILSNVPSTSASVYVAGKDVYVAGEEHITNETTAKLWKNGVTMALADSLKPAVANSVFVAGNNIYLAGLEANPVIDNYNTLAKIWKNGTATLLTDGSSPASANSVFVAGNDIYIAGSQFGGGKKTENANGGFTVVVGRNMAAIWKNGVITTLTDATKEASAKSVFVSNNKVYIAGFEAVSN